MLDDLAASVINVQRLLMALAAGGGSPQELAAALTRHGQGQGPETYQQLADPSLRFLARSMIVASAYATACLRDVVPPNRMVEVGEPPAALHPAGHADPYAWAEWYVLNGSWAAQQWAWSARAYEVLRDEVAAGRMSSDVVRSSGHSFLRDRLPDYLSDMAEISMDLIADGLSAAEESVRALSDALVGQPPATELTVDVHGRAATIARTDLAIENNRPDPADVECVVTPIAGIRLAVAPALFHLAPGQTERVSISVGLPDTPTDGPVAAGTIMVAGYGDTMLMVAVRATVDAAPRQGITVRALDGGTESAGVVGAGAGDRERP